jgi:hypothetical protein
MSPEKLAELPVYFGLHFDPATGKTYTGDGVDTGYTFERATWTGPAVWAPVLGVMNFVGGSVTGSLNPISFATQDTGLKVLQFARHAAPKPLMVSLDQTQRITGPFSRTIERHIVVSNGTVEESFSAGWMASSIIRNGEKRAAELWNAELKHAGLYAA